MRVTHKGGCVMCDLDICPHKGGAMKLLLAGIGIGMAASWYLFGPRIFSSNYDLSLSEADYV